jgi:phosphopantothenoylcysteine decarboxylase/phosphopantothenate--cysteine ligase
MKDARPTVVLCTTGSIAAYKAPIVARRLIERGIRVIPVMTRSALEFVGRATMSGLTGEAVRTDAFDSSVSGELHVELGGVADVVAIVPATADVLARLAAGRADDLVTATCLCAVGPVVVAPAMHPRMWDHPATRRNVETLTADRGVRFAGPVSGPVASGDVGMGRMAEPDDIVAEILRALSPQDLAGRHVVVTAGPTVEDLDPVRFLGNRSTGKMGFAVAERAAARGARVTLISGPVTLPSPYGVVRVDVRSTLEMQRALDAAMGADLGDADALVMTAAVADYRPKVVHDAKLKRDDAGRTLELVPNPDLLAGIGARRTQARPVLVGFAVETADDEGLVRVARGKLTKKRVDLVVANHAADSFGRDDNRALLVTHREVDQPGVTTKIALADRILSRVVELLGR